MFLSSGASLVYGAVARQRRRWYGAHPQLVRRLRQPVISVGNLAVGGRAKTPVVAALARWLADRGERPAILSRGYARERPRDGIVVVRDPAGIRATLAEAGDEPFMLAQSFDACAVLVGRDRYAAGRLAEGQLGCTVHLLDDGFQHLGLARDVDLVLVDPEDLLRGRPLPAGRLREPVSALEAADALLWVAEPGADARSRVPSRVAEFHVRRGSAPPEPLGPHAPPAPPARVVAVAGIAEPGRFFEGLRAAGWGVAAALPFADHHRYRPSDLRQIASTLRATGAAAVLTTAKDAVRLEALGGLPFPAAVVPLTVAIEPRAAFDAWLIDRLAARRRAPVR